MLDKLSSCILNKEKSYTPIWFMRQAGRYLPEFREIRKENKNFIKLCLDTELATKITLQPLDRFDLDAAIIFSDILMIPHGLGQEVEFIKGEGPKLKKFDLENVLNIKPNNFINNLKPVYKSISEVKNKLKDKCVIGFVGAPWTLLVYMLYKKSPKKNFDFNETIKDKSFTNQLLNKLIEIITLHIDEQIKAGANVIQIFDSWAGLLPPEKLNNFCFEPTLKILSKVGKKAPIICFPKGIGKNYSQFCSIVKPSCISIDYEIDIDWIKKEARGIPIQGGLDPKILLTNKSKIKEEVEKYLNLFSDYPYIFNLGHGVLPETNPETIEFIIKLVRERK